MACGSFRAGGTADAPTSTSGTLPTQGVRGHHHLRVFPTCRRATSYPCRSQKDSRGVYVATVASTLDGTPNSLLDQRELYDGIQEWDTPSSRAEALVLIERLQHNVQLEGTPTGLNVVALSGGLASALAAYLLTTVYEENCIACIATAADATDQRVERARFVADWLGLELCEWEMDPVPDETRDRAKDMSPVERRDLQLSRFLKRVSSGAAAAAEDEDDVVIFCGLRARDFASPDRRETLLRLTEEEKIACPLVFLSEAGVAALSLVVGLPEPLVAWLATPMPPTPLNAPDFNADDPTRDDPGGDLAGSDYMNDTYATGEPAHDHVDDTVEGNGNGVKEATGPPEGSNGTSDDGRRDGGVPGMNGNGAANSGNGGWGWLG